MSEAPNPRWDRSRVSDEATFWTLVACFAVLAAGCVYQLAVGLRWIRLGTLPGDGPPLDGWFNSAPVAVLAIGGVVMLGLGLVRRSRSTRTRAAIAATTLAAAAYPCCHAAAFDPYYLPSLQRFEANAGWLAVIILAALAISAISLRPRDRISLAKLGALMIASAVVTVGQGLH